MSDPTDFTGKRHHPNALSVQSGILDSSSPKDCVRDKSRNQSPLSNDNKNMAQSAISENSQGEKEEEGGKHKVSDSIDKIFKDRNRKIFTIGEKRVASGASSEESRERELVKGKGPVMLKGKEEDGGKEKDNGRKVKGGNINKELAKKYANKLEIGKVRVFGFMFLETS